MQNKTLVEWREWSDEAFREAREQDKPVLLDIGAVWCHWCHVMDGGIPGDPVHTGTYSNADVAQIIKERFVPIKVDNDRRPDINARYNMGGWPTTAFLTPRGDTLYGETYVTPDRMIGLLNHIADYYKSNKEEIAAKIAEHDVSDGSKPRAGVLRSEILTTISGHIKANFDFSFGGFGTQPKFPHTEALEFAIQHYSATKDEELRLIVEKTLDSMAGGGAYDKYAGGFFRYSTTRDWSIPHFEKMLEDNAKLSRVCLFAAKSFGEPRFADIAKDVHGWLLDVMYDAETGTFAGSQDADGEEAYYGLPLEKRAELPTPFIDRTAYCDWNALMVSSLVERYRQFGEAAVLEAAIKTYEFTATRIWPRHYYADNRSQGEEYLLTDVTALLHASLDLAEATGMVEYLDEARQYADVLLKRLQDHEQGGFNDLQPSAGALGALAKPKQEISGTSAAAQALLRLYVFTEDAIYRTAAEKGLQLYAEDFAKYTLFASGYALAVADVLTPAVHVVIVGPPDTPETDSLRKAAWRMLRITAVVETRSPERAGDFPGDPPGKALAYLCVGTTCHSPVSDPDGLKRLLDALASGD